MKLILALAVAVVAVVAFAAAPSPAEKAKEVIITGSDYAFQVPASLPAGTTTFGFENKGQHPHELNISLLKPGVSMDRLLKAVRAGESVKDLTDGPVGVLFASPGKRSRGALVAELLPGREYAVICIFTDSARAPRHYDLGMYSSIRVAPGEMSAPDRSIPVDTIVGSDYAFQYPRTVPAGRRRFAFNNVGKMRHEVSFALLKPGVTLQKVLETEKAGGDVEALMDGALGLLHARAGERPLGSFEVDMLPGREYLIVCYFKDDKNSPEHYELGMFGSIRVPERDKT